MKEHRKGFTLAELLIVVAIIAVLVAISIPVFTAQKHKSEVATDWANIRSYYAELQSDYISTEKYNPIVPVDWHSSEHYDWKNLTSLNGNKIALKAGIAAVSFDEGKGYTIIYECDSNHPNHKLNLGN